MKFADENKKMSIFFKKIKAEKENLKFSLSKKLRLKMTFLPLER